MIQIRCQLSQLADATKELGAISSLLQTRTRILRRAKRNATFLLKWLPQPWGRDRRIKEQSVRECPEFGAGESVMVLRQEEINQTLDNWNRCNGCLFIDEMYQYCGGTYRILKAVRTFYDETKKRTCKVKDVYLLEGVTCSGRQRLYTSSCGRNCFFFFQGAWLRKARQHGL